MEEAVMDTMKKFKTWVIVFGLLLIIIHLLTYFAMRRQYNDIEYLVEFESPELVITSVRGTNVNVNMRAELTNETEELIRDINLRFEFLNERGNYIGSEEKEIRFLNVGQTLPIEEGFRYRNVHSIRVSKTH